MNQYKYAAWVKGDYLTWAKKEQMKVDYPCGVKSHIESAFEDDPVYSFLSRTDSEAKLSTLKNIAALCIQNGGYKYTELELAANMLHYMETYGRKFGSAKKKDVTSALKQFRKATNNLFDAVNEIYGNNPLDLIENIPRGFLNRLVDGYTENEKIQKVMESLGIFQNKTTKQVLLEFSDRIEGLGTGNSYFLVNKGAPSESQMQIRILVLYTRDLIGLNAVKELTGFAPLIAHFVEIRSPTNMLLSSGDVSRQIKTAINILESMGKSEMEV
jgi:hypothetical protein